MIPSNWRSLSFNLVYSAITSTILNYMLILGDFNFLIHSKLTTATIANRFLLETTPDLLKLLSETVIYYKKKRQ